MPVAFEPGTFPPVGERGQGDEECSPNPSLDWLSRSFGQLPAAANSGTNRAAFTVPMPEARS